MGGIYNPFNLGLYSYSHLNPLRYSDPDGNAPFGGFLYNAYNGIQAHNVFSDYVRSQGAEWKANSTLANISEGLGLSNNRPDAVNTINKELFELKPVTHNNRPDLQAKDREQLTGYLEELGKAGDPHEAGDSTILAPNAKGGTNIGSFRGLNGSNYDVTIYPGKDKGMIYYGLKEQQDSNGKTRVFADDTEKALNGGSQGAMPPIPPMLIPVP